MFPQLWNETKDLVPEVFFGLADVPPYRRIELSGGFEIDDVVDAIHEFTWNENSSGYIDGDTVYFHGELDEEILVDLSKPFVFISQPSSPDGGRPTAWQVLRFLQEPVQKALFIGADSGMLIEKTDSTLALCGELDKVWAEDIPVADLMTAVEDSAQRGRLLAGLMRRHEISRTGHSSEMWHFWETFGLHLMISSLRLELTIVLFESEAE